MSLPLVSFFVQAYNTGPWVRECLRSVLSQHGGYHFEVIVIDDASTDNTRELIAGFSDSRIHFIPHARNQGPIETANEGYAAMRGRYIIRVDSDDRLRPQFLSRAVPVLESNPRVGFVYGDIATMNERGQITCEGDFVKRGGRPPMGDEFFPLLLDNFVPAPTTLIRREALQQLLPVPSSFSFLDWYITTGIAENWLTYFVDEVLADYRVHPSNAHSSMILDRTGEKTIFQVLETLSQNGRRSADKDRWRRRVYAAQYLKLGDNYFGCGMNADARRCYWRAAANVPTKLFQRGIGRRFLATCLPRSWYDSAKRAGRLGLVQAAKRI